MCTSIAFKTDDFYFGRNMDLEYDFGQKVVITPRNYVLQFRKERELKSHYALIGMASVAGDYPLYAEAANEHGLCMASLNFPDNAYYSERIDDTKHNISPFELIPFVLSRCKDLNAAKELLLNTHIVAINFSENIKLTPLHWHIADKSGSIVLETTKGGMYIYDNPVNALTNNPPFDFQLTNLSHYLNLTTKNPENSFYDSVGFKAFGKGLGSFGLPGDFSPASRFVKAAFLLSNSICKSDNDSSVSQFFHILDSVSVVNGSVFLDENHEYITTYSCCINADKGIYYYKSYSNNQISVVDMNREDLETDDLIKFEIIKKQQYFLQNH